MSAASFAGGPCGSGRMTRQKRAPTRRWMLRESGASSTPRPIRSTAGVPEYWIVRSSRTMTGECAGRSLPYRIYRLRIDENARVEHALRIEFSFRGPKCRREQRRALTIVPGPVIAADRVMMGDRTARLDQRVAACGLDSLPLLQQRAVAAERVERKIRRGSVGIDMRDAARDLACHSGRREDRALRRRLHGVVESFEAVPGD